ncbi:N-acetyltransferase, partial [bacterium]
LSLRDRAGIVGAMMISATGETLGLYNLCVAPRKRGAGVGTELVRWVRAHSPIPVTLQCDRRLESWYRKIGFRTEGALRFFGLASARSSDTI